VPRIPESNYGPNHTICFGSRCVNRNDFCVKVLKFKCHSFVTLFSGSFSHSGVLRLG
jgi:hypothetical protein